MRVIALAAVSALALGAAACVPHVNPTQRTRLDCPDRAGELVRVSQSADGKTCGYRAEDAEITLQLMPVSGDPMTTLNGVEQGLVGTSTAPASSSGAPKPPQPPAPPAPPAAGGDAAKVAAEASKDAGGDGDSDKDWTSGQTRHSGVIIDKDGRHVVTADGDTAHISLPGLHVDADGDKAKVDIAGIHIDAANDEATIRVVRDVRLKGEAFSAEKRGIRATFIAKRAGLPDGDQVVAYEASGPKAGPLTVATVRSKGELDDGNRLYHDIQRLVRRNGGA